ncbi:MAG: cbb3-type cytochrome c oxidase subunit II [Terracidiphilus sp.]|nr:cbb3-type cytochrome c oxidase subunit II [Terracidiphilus sp.]
MRAHSRLDGWRGAALVAITYIYFLIFAQFGFLERMTECGVTGAALKCAMAAMAAGGILFSLLVPRLVGRTPAATLLRTGLGVCASAAAIAIAPFGFIGAMVVAGLTGSGLGILTVSLVTHLPGWAGQRNPILMVGIGTGAGYFVCNIPAVFCAAPEYQALIAAVLCVAGVLIVSSGSEDAQIGVQAARGSFPLVLLSFAALVWLDSAAFYIIQHTATLKAGTWAGNLHLWTNACIHLAAALAAALLLQARRVNVVLASACVALGFACILLLHPALALPASAIYPAGVSLYSVALVAYPAFLSGKQSLQKRARIAGWIYAVAGWMGSVLGIGMGQNLGHVPPAFVLVASAAVLGPILFPLLRIYRREAVALGVSFALALALYRALPQKTVRHAATAEERGRQVYISEGCISCHSQYVRPGTQDEAMWGPVESMEQVHAQKPPLIGNRRQGPDLSQVGARRSRLWLRAHLIAPAALSSASPMPPYALLFTDERGNDLVAYLASLRTEDGKHLQQQAEWQLSETAWRQVNADEGEPLYRRHCATCHASNGAAQARWGAEFQSKPPELAALKSHCSNSSPAQVERIVRFGLRGTEMPGHEYLSEHEIASLTLWLMQLSALPVPHP